MKLPNMDEWKKFILSLLEDEEFMKEAERLGIIKRRKKCG